VFSDKIGALEELSRKLNHSIERTIGLRAHVRLVRPQTIARSEGKARRLIDLREE
jgi:phenylacetate-CoA ligase